MKTNKQKNIRIKDTSNKRKLEAKENSNSKKSKEGKNKFGEENDFESNITAVGNNLKRLNNITGLDYTNLSPSTSGSKDNGTRSYHGRKIKNNHVKCLKGFLNKNKFIGSFEAMRLLYKETGLKVSYKTISKCLKWIRKEMGLENVNRGISIVKSSQPSNRSVLKGTLKNCIKEYLGENKHITSAEAMSRFAKETDLEVDKISVHNAMTKLRKDMNLECFDLSISTYKNKQSSYESILMDTKLVFLKRYVKKNRFIGPVDAMNKLREETGLDFDILSIHQSLKNLKK